jgi:hypothetical protein
MNRTMIRLAAVVWAAGQFALSAAQAQVVGPIAVLRVGDGTAALANTGNAMFIDQFTAGGTSAGGSVTIPSTGASGFQISGVASSEGLLTLSADGTQLVFGGYNPGAGGFTGSGSLSSRTSAQAPRGYGTVSVATGTYTFGQLFSGTNTDFSQNNIRSVVQNGSNFYGAGGNSGTVLAPSTSISTTNTNQRYANIQNGNYYYSTGAGTQGIYTLGAPPTSGPVTGTPVLTAVTGQGTNPYGYAFSPGPLAAGSFLYVGDNTLGVQKFTYNGSVWALAYALTTPSGQALTDIAVDFSGVNPVIYAVSANSGNTVSDILQFTDTGSAGAMTVLATAPASEIFRGIELLPTAVPEPGSLALLGFAGAGLVWRRWRK